MTELRLRVIEKQTRQEQKRNRSHPEVIPVRDNAGCRRTSDSVISTSKCIPASRQTTQERAKKPAKFNKRFSKRLSSTVFHDTSVAIETGQFTSFEEEWFTSLLTGSLQFTEDTTDEAGASDEEEEIIDLVLPSPKTTAVIAKRSRIIREMAETELSYVRFLSILEETFIQPLKKLQNTSQAILSEMEIALIFRNVCVILEKHRKLYKSMKVRLNDDNQSPLSPFCDVLVTLFDDNDISALYQEYINFYEQAGEVLRDKLLKNSKFKSFVDNGLAKHKKFINFPGLRSFLIMPVQRLPRYIMLLQDLKRHTPEGHADFEHVQKALAAAMQITSHINTGKELFEQASLREQLINRFPKMADRVTLLNNVWPDESVVAQGIVNVHSTWPPVAEETTSRFLIVFSHHIIICTYNSEKPVKNNAYPLTLEIMVNICAATISKIYISDILQAIQMFYLKPVDEFPFFTKQSLYFSADANLVNDKKLESSNNASLVAGASMTVLLESWERHLEAVLSDNVNYELLTRYSFQTKSHLQDGYFLPEMQSSLFSFAKSQTYQDQQPVIEEGNLSDKLFYVEKGALNIVKNIDNTSVVINTLYESELVGEIGFLANSTSAPAACASVVSNGESTVYAVTFTKLRELLNNSKETGWKFYYLLCILLSYRLIRLNWVYSISQTENNNIVKAASSANRLLQKSRSGVTNETVSSSSRSSLQLSKEEIAASSTSLLAIAASFQVKYRLNKTGKWKQGILDIAEEHLVVSKKSKRRIGSKPMVIPSIRVLQLTEEPIILHLSVLMYDETEKKTIGYTLSLQFSDMEEYISGLRQLNHLRAKKTKAEDDNTIIIPGVERSFTQGDPICTQGELSENVYQILSGSCHVTYTQPGSETAEIVTELKQGSIFGELGFIMGLVASGGVVVSSNDALIVCCSRGHLESLNADETLKFYRKLVNSIRDKFCSLEARLAALKA